MVAKTDSGGRFYRPELDVVRFLAFVLVFFHHTLPDTSDPRVAHLLRGYGPAFDALGATCGYGMCLFFALSAFLICELLIRERESSGTVGVKQFYIRRILRIWPVYYLALAIGLMFTLLPGAQPGAMAKIGWYAIFMGSWYAATQPPIYVPISQLWSISVEEQFYVFAPWVMKYLSRKLLYGFCAALVLVSNLWICYLGHTLASDKAIWFNAFVQYECFAGGILLCLVLRGRLPRIVTWQRVVLIFLSFALWFYTCNNLRARFGMRGGQNPGAWVLMGGYALTTLGSVLILIAFLGADGKLFPQWAVYLGRISFGLYVFNDFSLFIIDRLILQNASKFHGPLMNALRAPTLLLSDLLALGLTILMAAISYRYFETPFLKMKKHHAVIESQPIAGAS
jgi:peptidoglycan/LPS O-acetylase OafA/YrhL